MQPLHYHHGQVAVQDEANTRHVADKLAGWVGPAERYATTADLVLFAILDAAGTKKVLRFAVLSGAPPLVLPVAPGRLELPLAIKDVLALTDDPGAAGTPIGGLVLSLATAERARVNGVARQRDGRVELEASEEFTLCRKYLAPSIAVRNELSIGPATREPVALDDPWTNDVVAAATTSFLASVSPDAGPDVAHRGGPPGFLAVDAVGRTVAWTEYVGDGVFKSAGNVRATGIAALLILDLARGDGLELAGTASYENVLTRFRPRTEPLVRFPEPFPTQGRMLLAVETAHRLRGVAHARQPVAGNPVTSRDEPEEQAPR